MRLDSVCKIAVKELPESLTTKLLDLKFKIVLDNQRKQSKAKIAAF